MSAVERSGPCLRLPACFACLFLIASAIAAFFAASSSTYSAAGCSSLTSSTFFAFFFSFFLRLACRFFSSISAWVSVLAGSVVAEAGICFSCTPNSFSVFSNSSSSRRFYSFLLSYFATTKNFKRLSIYLSVCFLRRRLRPRVLHLRTPLTLQLPPIIQKLELELQSLLWERLWSRSHRTCYERALRLDHSLFWVPVALFSPQLVEERFDELVWLDLFPCPLLLSRRESHRPSFGGTAAFWLRFPSFKLQSFLI